MIDIGALLLLAFITSSMALRIWSGVLGFPRLRGAVQAFNTGSTPSESGFLSHLTSVLVLDVGASRPLRTCNKVKWSSHVLIFWGFVFTAIATTLAYFLKPEGAVLPFTNPVKLFGNAGGALLLVGCSAMFYARYQEGGSIWQLHRSDYFLISLLLTAATGFVAEDAIYAFGREGVFTPYAYWVHIAVIISLLATAPYSKFTHAFYKPSWLLFQRLTWDATTPVIGTANVGMGGNPSTSVAFAPPEKEVFD